MRALTLKPPRQPDPLEAVHQERIFNRIPLYLDRYPELALLFAVPNGGFRHKATAVAMQKQGQKAGVPDMCLPVRRGGFHALFIELSERKVFYAE